jgi:hypothetical protein
MVPALILTLQWEKVPVPFPILTSVGFVVIGMVGNIFIHNFPFRFNFLLMACLAASICRDEIVPDFTAFKPMFPNCNLFERKFSFDSVPFRIFLYLVFLGYNIVCFL